MPDDLQILWKLAELLKSYLNHPELLLVVVFQMSKSCAKKCPDGKNSDDSDVLVKTGLSLIICCSSDRIW